MMSGLITIANAAENVGYVIIGESMYTTLSSNSSIPWIITPSSGQNLYSKCAAKINSKSVLYV